MVVHRCVWVAAGLACVWLGACEGSASRANDPSGFDSSNTEDTEDGGTSTDGIADGAGPELDGDTTPANPPITEGKRCHLHLHWAGGSGQPDSLNSEGVTEVWPQSPGGAFWLYDGPHDMQYDPDTGDAEYQSIVTFLEGVLADRECGPTIVVGYSNGAGLAAKLFCKGQDFGGRVWGYLVDDPVMDDGVRGCSPSPNIRNVLFTHSEELRDDAAAADHNCSVTGWYCEDNRTMPVDEYETVIGHDSILQREFHGGGGWVDNENAAWAVPARWWEEDF